jgi:multiple sugar transport system substrate-binding protein
MYAKKWSTLVSLLGVMAMILVACTPASPTPAASAPTTAPTTAQAPQPITLQFWDGLGAPDNVAMQNLIKQYNAENKDGITIQDTELDWDTLYSKLALDFKTGNAPDALTLQQTDILEEQTLGILQPIDDLYKQLGIDPTDIIDVAWKGAQVDGKQYAIPIDVHPLTLYINVKEFQAAGLDPNKPPTTMDEFLADAQKLTDPSKGQYGFGSGYNGGLPFRIWMSLIWQHKDGQVLTPDGTKAAFNSPAGIESLQFMSDLVYKYKVSPQSEDDVDSDFKKGIIGMVIEGPWEMADFDTVQGLEYKTAMIPVFYDQQAAWANSHTIAFPDNKKPENTLAAMKFTKWLFDHNFDWTKNTGHQPVRKSVINSSEFKALVNWQPIAATVPIAHFYPAIPQEWEVFARQPTSPFVVMMQSVMLNKATVPDAISTAEKTVNGILSSQ